MSEFKGTVKDVVGYEGLYCVSDLGIVYSLRTWNGKSNRELKFHYNSFGYPRFSLTKSGKTSNITAHKIVTRAFIGELPKGMQVRHLDGNKDNFKLINLVYGTAKENAEDREAHGTTAKGENVGTSKLSNEDVSSIKLRYRKRGDMAMLAREYNVSCATIYHIINGISRSTNTTSDNNQIGSYETPQRN